MKQYIDKSVLVAELERRRNKNSKSKLFLAAAFEDNYLLSFIDDNLEVKEVDLDFTAIAMPSDSSIWVNHDDLPCLEDGDNVEILIIKK